MAIVGASHSVPTSTPATTSSNPPEPLYGPTITLDKGASIEWEKATANFGVGGYRYFTQQAENQLASDPSIHNNQYETDLYQADYWLGTSVWAQANIAMKQAAPLQSQLNAVNEQIKQLTNVIAHLGETGWRPGDAQLIKQLASLERQKTELDAHLKPLKSQIENLNSDWQSLQAQENSYLVNDPALSGLGS
jgi:hypothetical protein